MRAATVGENYNSFTDPHVFSNPFLITAASTGTAPTISSADSTTATVGSAFTFPVVASGSPAPTLSNTAFTGCTPSTLPSGVTFNDGVLSGTPPDGSVGSYTVCVQAANGVTPNATQTLTLTVGTAQLTVTASSPSFDSRRHGADDHAGLLGFVNSDTAASLTTAPTCSTTATSSSTAGALPFDVLGRS